MSILDEIEKISARSYSESYDSDHAVLDLMAIHDLAVRAVDPRLDAFEELFLRTYEYLHDNGYIGAEGKEEGQ